MGRPNRNVYFMDIAKLVATRSTCIRRHVGAIAVLNDRILATGYNGSPVGGKHCEDTGCLRETLGVKSGERHELCVGVHAEQNVIVSAAKHGTSIYGSTIYSTTFPCSTCAKMLINCGVSRIVFDSGYPDELSGRLLKESRVELCQIMADGRLK